MFLLFINIALNATFVGLTSTRTVIKYLLFSFLRSGNEAKRVVEFRLWTSNVLRIQRKVGNENVFIGTECLNTRFLGSLCLTWYVPDTASNNATSLCIRLLLPTLLHIQRKVNNKKPYNSKLNIHNNFEQQFLPVRRLTVSCNISFLNSTHKETLLNKS